METKAKTSGRVSVKNGTAWARLLVAFVAALVAGGLAGSAWAAVIYDDFPGTSLNTSLWTPTLYQTPPASSITVGSSVVTVVSGDIQSTSSWTYGNFEFKIGGNFSGLCSFGLGATGLTFSMRNDVGPGPYTIYLSGNQIATTDGASPITGDVFNFVWQPGLVELYKNASLIGGTTINVPSSAMTLGMGSYPAASVAFDSVSIIVPEPSCAVLLAAGLFGLLGSARRKQR